MWSFASHQLPVVHLLSPLNILFVTLGCGWALLSRIFSNILSISNVARLIHMVYDSFSVLFFSSVHLSLEALAPAVTILVIYEHDFIKQNNNNNVCFVCIQQTTWICFVFFNAIRLFFVLFLVARLRWRGQQKQNNDTFSQFISIRSAFYENI